MIISCVTALSYTDMLLSGGVPGATLHRKLAPERLTSRDASDNSIASEVVCLQMRKVNKHHICLQK